MIKSPEAVQAFIDALNELEIPYLVTGSLVSNSYGEPRVTYDADFVADVEVQTIGDLQRRLGPSFEREAQLAFATVTGKVQHKFLHRDSGIMIEVFELSRDEHDLERFRRRVHKRFLDRMAYIPTPEDVIVQKLRWLKRANRSKDRRDAVKVISRRDASLDWPYIEKWCREHGTVELLGDVRREAAEDQASSSA